MIILLNVTEYGLNLSIESIQMFLKYKPIRIAL